MKRITILDKGAKKEEMIMGCCASGPTRGRSIV